MGGKYSRRWSTTSQSIGNLVGGLALFTVFVIGSVMPGAGLAHACSCGPDPVTMAALLNKSNTTAFIGRATSVSAISPQGTVTYTFAVDRAIKGNRGPTITVQTAAGGSECGVEFPLNVSLGVALVGTGKADFKATQCGGHLSTQNVAAFETLASGTLPAPPGSGAIAGFTAVTDDTVAVVDDQLRVLGYIPDLRFGTPEACPGDRYLYGTYVTEYDSDGFISEWAAFRVDLATLTVTRYSDAGLNDVFCIDSDGTLILSESSDAGAPSSAFVKMVPRLGASRTIPAVPGYTNFHGPAGDSESLAWSTTTEVVVTDLNGAVKRRIPYTTPDPNGPFALIDGGYLFDQSANRKAFSVTSLATGTTFTVDSPYSEWRSTSDHLYRLLNPTTLEAIELPAGTRSQIPITNGPSATGWVLQQPTPTGSQVLVYGAVGGSPEAPNFYVISPTGSATSYPAVSGMSVPTEWWGGTFTSTSSNDDGEAWLLATTGVQRVLNGYFVGPWIEPLNSRITLSPDACGRTSIPTRNYQCSLSPPVQRLPDTL